MKRSDMVAKIYNKLHGTSVSDMCYGPDFAEKLLTFIEDLGMTPPSYTGLIANGRKFNKENDFGRDVQFFRDWEPEDEA